MGLYCDFLRYLWHGRPGSFVHSTVQKVKELLIVLGLILKLRWPVFLCETTAGAASSFPTSPLPSPTFYRTYKP